LLLSADYALRSASGWGMPGCFACSDRPGCRASSPAGAAGPRLGWLGTSAVLTALTDLNAAEAGVAGQLGPGGLLLVGAMTRRRGPVRLLCQRLPGGPGGVAAARRGPSGRAGAVAVHRGGAGGPGQRRGSRGARDGRAARRAGL